MKLEKMKELATSHNFVAVIENNKLAVYKSVYNPFSGETVHEVYFFSESEYNKLKHWIK